MPYFLYLFLRLSLEIKVILEPKTVIPGPTIGETEATNAW